MWDPDGKLCLILAQDSDGGCWSDFGGGLQWRGEHERACARRELQEESHDVICVSQKRLGKSPTFRFHFVDRGKCRRHYTTYVVQVPFNRNLSKRFNKRRGKIRHNSVALSPRSRDARLEKCSLNYFQLDEMVDPLRPFFKKRLGLLAPTLEKLQDGFGSAPPVSFELKPP